MTPGDAAVRNPRSFSPPSAAARLLMSCSTARAFSYRTGPLQAGIRSSATPMFPTARRVKVRNSAKSAAAGIRPLDARKSAQPILDVGRVRRLAHLAVIDQVDAGLDLPVHDFANRPSGALCASKITFGLTGATVRPCEPSSPSSTMREHVNHVRKNRIGETTSQDQQGRVDVAPRQNREYPSRDQ